MIWCLRQPGQICRLAAQGLLQTDGCVCVCLRSEQVTWKEGNLELDQNRPAGPQAKAVDGNERGTYWYPAEGAPVEGAER